MTGRFEVISTPCRQVCRIAPQDGLCDGCGRSLAEIAGWSAMSEAERLAIMATLADRLENRQTQA